MLLNDILLEDRTEYLLAQHGEKIADRFKDDPVIRQRFSTPKAFMDFLVEIDPTPTRKFVQWLLTLFLKGKFRLEDAYKAKSYLADFLRVRTRLEIRDINQYGSLPDLFAALEPFQAVEVVSNRQADRQAEQAFYANGEARLVHDASDLKIVHLLSEKAACWFGRGTQWCTAATTSDNAFKGYADTGSLYVLIPRGSDQKYQLYFDTYMSSKDEYMDPQDREVSFGVLLKRWPDLIDILQRDLSQRYGFMTPDRVQVGALTQDPLSILSMVPNEKLIERAYKTLGNFADVEACDILCHGLAHGVAVPDKLWGNIVMTRRYLLERLLASGASVPARVQRSRAKLPDMVELTTEVPTGELFDAMLRYQQIPDAEAWISFKGHTPQLLSHYLQVCQKLGHDPDPTMVEAARKSAGRTS